MVDGTQMSGWRVLFRQTGVGLERQEEIMRQIHGQAGRT